MQTIKTVNGWCMMKLINSVHPQNFSITTQPWLIQPTMHNKSQRLGQILSFMILVFVLVA